LSAPYLKEQDGGTCLSVKLQPRASKNEIGAPLGEELKIKVAAPPVDGAANAALVAFLAAKLGCSRSACRILRGETSRHKTVLIAGLSAAEVLSRLKI
jgi:uncharacterized protein (TIGR00251 family)